MNLPSQYIDPFHQGYAQYQYYPDPPARAVLKVHLKLLAEEENFEHAQELRNSWVNEWSDQRWIIRSVGGFTAKVVLSPKSRVGWVAKLVACVEELSFSKEDSDRATNIRLVIGCLER